MCSFIVVDGSKFSFQLTSYLAGDISPESIVMDVVVLDRDVDLVIVIPESPITLPVFGMDAFSCYQHLETYCLMIGPSHDGSSSLVGGVPINIFSPNRKCI